MNDRPESESVLDRLADPRPALIVGTLAWLVAVVVVIVTQGGWSDTATTCAAGVGVGFAGYALFLAQRRSARRGDRGAQQGLV
ncbi:DUF2530 domain-containing protein [Rhodococcus sp. NPDC058521]|uniref:DUF2530 domain-containing protein n=1 Tax=Rhodococcus sp. NPDC058521 TaxID=3346536 RepID=UPI0036672F2D